MNERPAPSVLYDWSMALASLWLSGGILLDAWFHFHATVETFFEPAHALLYAGLLASYVFTAIAWRRGLPPGYELTVAGLVATLLGGVLDMTKHALFGFEEGFSALVSPTHLVIGAGMFLIMTGPIRAALIREPHPSSLFQQLPMLLALASMMELIHWGTQFVFLTGAESINAPLSPSNFPHDTLTLIALQYYKQGIGLVSVIFQSLLITGFALFALRRITLAPGALTILLLAGNIFIAAAHANTSAQFIAVMVASALAGICGDSFRLAPQSGSAIKWAFFSFALPAVYFGALLSYLAAAMRGLWWPPDVIFGAVLFAGFAGLFTGALSSPATSQPR